MWNYILLSSVVLMSSLFYHYQFNKPIGIIENPNSYYDYIVVGAGTTGCVIASRLSDLSNTTVLLVEAGGYFNWMSAMPLMAPLMQGTSLDWAYKTETQKFSSLGLWSHQQSWPRGKGLGGSGQINYLVHSFGRSEDYETWPKGWSYGDLIPYFKKVTETMSVTTFSSNDPLIAAFMEAELSIGSNDATFQKGSYTVKRGNRWSTYHAYLQNTIKNRNNLHVLMNTLVTKILFNETKTIGVEVLYKNASRGKINVRREVILCAGTVNTVQLLLLSGIGPRKDLNEYQIRTVSDLPEVGKNLFDHMNVPVYVNLKASVSLTLRKMQSIQEIAKYLLFGTGSLSSNRVLATARVNNSGIILFGVASTDEKLLKDIANYQTETFRSLFPAYNDTGHEGFLYLATCLQPKSRGNVTLKSRSIFDQPKIDPAYLQNDDDVHCTHKAINLALETLNSRKFREYGAHVHLPDFEECRHFRQDYRDRDYSECVMRIGGVTSHHPCGSCRMGTDDNAVIDDKLRVRGVIGLRIMDASILPSPISGTPNSVLIAMAERAFDVITERTSN
ncbi:neither inactivation nor afterpotential protein G-like [Vespa mandarinia]|uniref:neither inactivation nor afterpotential protein G-like n=1 Tax=Vespa mandarinia TaxID=7446 RepID=UPI00161D6F35|nr:neither inactivation nor afterpotential protein G-like [Vespa mandarinia]